MRNTDTEKKTGDVAFDVDQFVQVRHNNVLKYLDESGLSHGEIHEIVNEYYQPGDILLMTSSPVYGFATQKSDIDLMLISGQSTSSEIPATLYGRKKRIDLYRYNQADVASKLKALATIDTADSIAVIDAVANWNRSFPGISKTNFERLINGITTESHMPYVDYLPRLARIWIVESYLKSVTLAVYARLSFSAGKERSSAAYLLNSIFYIMNTLTARTGLIFSNRKHSLLGWKYCMEQKESLGFRETVDDVNHCFKVLTEYFTGRDSSSVRLCLSALRRVHQRVEIDMKIGILERVGIIRQQQPNIYKILDDVYLAEGASGSCLMKNDLTNYDPGKAKSHDADSDHVDHAEDVMALIRLGVYRVGIEGHEDGR